MRGNASIVSTNIRSIGLSCKDLIDLQLYLFFAHNVSEDAYYICPELYNEWVDAPENIGYRMLLSVIDTDIRGDNDYTELIRLGALQK